MNPVPFAMIEMPFSLLAVVLLATIIVLVVLFGTSRVRWFLGVTRGAAAAWFFASLLAGGAAAAWRVFQLNRIGNEPWHNSFGSNYWGQTDSHAPNWVVTLSVISAALFGMLTLAFVVKLYLKWIAGHVTDAEKQSGMDGLRAWLQGGNLPCAAFIALFGWFGFGLSFWGILALTILALVAYPVLNAGLAATPATPTKPAAPDASVERERVLKMLDDGKITAAESAELMNALSLAQAPKAPPAESINAQRKMVLAGLVLLLIGFFLPWFTVNPGDEMKRTMEQMQQNMPNGFNMQTPAIKTGTVNVAGGDIGRGLGWIVLLIGIAAAALPYFASNLRPQDRSKATLVGLSIGALILIYLLTQNLRFVSVGILLALIGYALQFLGTLQEKQNRLA